MSSPAPRVVLVTGASSGIGRAAALRAAGAGDHVVLAARDRGSLEEAAAECDAAGATSVLVVPTDVGDDEAVEALFARAIDTRGRVDAVISAAGVVSYGRVEDTPASVVDRVVRTNLLGSVNVARHAVRHFREREAGALVLVGSVIGHIAVPTMTPYVISKWGVRALARQLQLENRDLSGVRIEYVAPGGVDTPIYAQAANYAGFVGRPPPPVSSPEHAALQVLSRLERHHLREQLSVTNDVIRFGFTALPAVYDLLISPFFALGATDLTRPVEPGPGNVLDSRPDGNGLHGDQGNALLGIARNVRRRVERAVGR